MVDEPLVWVPFEISDPPPGLRIEVVPEPVERAANDPAALQDLVGYVLPYRLESSDIEFADRAPNLRWVQSLTVGVDHLLGLAPEVMLCNAQGLHTASTAELALTLTLSSLRGLPDFVRNQDQRNWQVTWDHALAEKQVLVIGAGDIATAIKARMEAFECTVTLVGRTARGEVRAITELPDLLPSADVVVLIVPLTEQTHHLVDADFLAAMAPGALLVNVARGPVVDTDALVSALNEGRIRAAVDVTDPEPLPPEHPLWRAPGVLITPHVGGTTSVFWPRAQRLIRAQLLRFVAGTELSNVITVPRPVDSLGTATPGLRT